jgi:putative ABC transport system permease protein
MTAAIGPTWEGLAWACVPVLAVMAILAWRRLGQVGLMALAVVRMTAQLWLLGLALGWVFAARSAGLVGAVALAMLLAASHTVGVRHRRRSWVLRAEAFAAMLLGLVIVMAVALRLALQIEPWYEPRTVIPLLGMVLGNSVSGVSLAVDRLEGELRAERDRVELRLALGATSRQAALPALRAAVRAALTPILNSMMIAGIVAIPGMTTGQILAGADLGTAIRYQILIYLGISATVCISTLALLAIRLRHCFTPAHQLRVDRLDDAPH